MRLTRETCVAGHVIDVSLKVSSGPGSGKRAPRTAPTPEDVRKVNDRNAEKDLGRKLNHNFVPGDWHLVLTYAGTEPDKQKAKQDLEGFKRRLKKHYEQSGRCLKWISVTEYRHDRIHHHIVLSYAPYEELAGLWLHGDIRPSRLKNHRNYRKLASYLIKETSKTYNLPGSVTRRRYNCSRSIITPAVKRERIGFVELERDPKPVKGYYIDEDSVRRGIHPITGYPFLEYEMISLAEEPRLKRWSRGIKVRKQENYNYVLRGLVTEAQLEMQPEAWV